MTDSSKLRRIKMHVEASKRHHANAIDTTTDALDGDIRPKDALASIRTALEASRGHVDSAHTFATRRARHSPACCLRAFTGNTPVAARSRRVARAHARRNCRAR